MCNFFCWCSGPGRPELDVFSNHASKPLHPRRASSAPRSRPSSLGPSQPGSSASESASSSPLFAPSPLWPSIGTRRGARPR